MTATNAPSHHEAHAHRHQAPLWISLVFLGFGGSEVALSWFVESGLLRADGLHNLIDAGVFGAASLLHQAISPRQQVVTHYLHGLFGPAAYTIGLASSIPLYRASSYAPASLSSTRLLFAIGLISLGINLACHRSCTGNMGFSVHLRSDMIAAVALVATALTDSPEMRGFIEGLALASIIVVAWREIKADVHPKREA